MRALTTPVGEVGGDAELVSGAPAFVGRGRELAAAARALGRPPALVLIEGEAGIGKTRLLTQLLTAHARSRKSGRALVAVCPPFREPHTLGPVIDAIRQATGDVASLRLSDLAGVLRPLLPEWSADLPPALEPAHDPSSARHRLFRALQELFEALRVDVMALEDAQWADDTTVEFVLFLASQRPPQVSVVVTHRPDELSEDSLLPRLASRISPGFTGARLQLGPLTAPETIALASSMLHGEQVSSSLADFLYESTDGVPLAVEESVRLMLDRAELIKRGDGWAPRHAGVRVIPPTVRDAVSERVKRLGQRAQTILHAAAMLGEATDPAIVRIVSGLPPDEAASGLEDALRSMLLVEDERGLIAFRHASSGRAVYEAIAARERREMHLRAAWALEGVVPTPVARLARHFREAGEHAQWCRYAEQMTDQALAAGDDGLAAATLCELAVRSDRSPGEMLRIVRRYISTAPVGDDQLRNLAASLRSALDGGAASPDEAAGLRVQLGRFLFNLQLYEAGRAQLEQALAHPGLDATDRARAMVFLGFPFESSQPAHVHRRWLRRAGEAVAQVESPDRRTLEMERATGLLLLGEQEGWSATAAIDEQRATLLPSLRITHDVNVSDMAMMWGLLGESQRRLARALETPLLREYPRVHGMALVNQARLDWFCGAWDGLRRRAGDLAGDQELGLAAPSRSEARLVVGLLTGVTAADRDDAHKALESVLTGSQELDPRFALELVAARARLMLEYGDVGAALALTEDPIGMVAGRGVWIWGTDLVPARVTALLAADRAEDAAALTAGFSRGLRGREAPGPRAALLLCRALVEGSGDTPARAAALFEAAANAWMMLPRPYEALLARERGAACLLQTHDGSGPALSQLAQVAQGLTALGAARDAERVNRALRDNDVAARPTRRRGRPSYGRQLSPREWQVVDLVVEGRSNAQIAESLLLSPHTVRMHVRSAMRKLETPSRKTLSIRAAEMREMTRHQAWPGTELPPPPYQ